MAVGVGGAGGDDRSDGSAPVDAFPSAIGGTANSSSCVVPTAGAAGDNMEVKAIVEDAKEVLQGHDGRCAPEGNGNLSFIVNGAGVRSQTVNCRTSVVVNLEGSSLSETKLKQLVEEEVREEVRKQMASTSI